MEQLLAGLAATAVAAITAVGGYATASRGARRSPLEHWHVLVNELEERLDSLHADILMREGENTQLRKENAMMRRVLRDHDIHINGGDD